MGKSPSYSQSAISTIAFAAAAVALAVASSSGPNLTRTSPGTKTGTKFRFGELSHGLPLLPGVIPIYPFDDEFDQDGDALGINLNDNELISTGMEVEMGEVTDLDPSQDGIFIQADRGDRDNSEYDSENESENKNQIIQNIQNNVETNNGKSKSNYESQLQLKQAPPKSKNPSAKIKTRNYLTFDDDNNGNETITHKQDQNENNNKSKLSLKINNTDDLDFIFQNFENTSTIGTNENETEFDNNNEAGFGFGFGNSTVNRFENAANGNASASGVARDGGQARNNQNPFNNYSSANNGFPSNNNVNLRSGVLLGGDDLDSESDLPMYLRVTAFIFLMIIFAVGTIGNTMVIIVIHCSRDMRTSTNIFLVNLSVADLLVLLICTPTCIMEVYYDPEIWLLGAGMCKLVPLLEVIVAHASVLTILAISFERYYAICCPLKANYVCTKTRAISICVSTWFAAGVITSPMYLMINYYVDSTNKPHCEVGAGTFWADTYTISSTLLFFLLPLLILLITYTLIARNLTTDRSRLNHNYTRQNHRARQQVVLMLGTVVFTFFLCLLPFRVLTMFILLSENNPFTNSEVYYNIEYFCRIMLYTNSALNPILYNIMSSKFRNGFLILCSRKRRRLSRFQRQGTFHTLTTTSSTSTTSNLPNNFIHSTATAIPISQESTKDRNRLSRLGLCRGSRCACACGYPCGCTCGYCATCYKNQSNFTGHFWTGKIMGNNQHMGHGCYHDFTSKNKNKNLDLDRYSYSFTNVNLTTSPKYNQTLNCCKKCCEFETNKSRLGARWLHKHLALTPGGTSTTTSSSAIIVSQNSDSCEHQPCCNGNGNGNGNGGCTGNDGGSKCHCHFYCMNSQTYSRGISSENNITEKCFSLNCQICQRRRKGHILAAVQEDRNRRLKAANNGVDGTGGKLTIKMAMKTNYYSCSFSSFSNTNTMETIL